MSDTLSIFTSIDLDIYVEIRNKIAKIHLFYMAKVNDDMTSPQWITLVENQFNAQTTIHRTPILHANITN